MKKALLITLIYIIASIIAFANEYTFRRIDTTDGLPDNEVKKVFSMPDGRIGIYTSSQLSLYDGCDFKTISLPIAANCYKTHSTYTLPITYIDDDNNVWIKDRGTIFVIDSKKEILCYDIKERLARKGIYAPIEDFFIDNQKGFWAITNKGELCYAPAYQQAIKVALPTNKLRDIYRNGNKIWMVYNNGLVIGWTLNNRKMFFKSQLWKHNMEMRDFIKFCSNGEDLWLLWDKGVTHYNSRTKKWEKQFEVAGQNIMTDIIAIEEGRAFVAVRHDKLWLLDSQHPNLNKPISLTTGTGYTITDDINTLEYHCGNLFIGLYASGLCYYNANANLQKFPFIPISQRSMFNTYGYRLYAISNGDIYLLAADGIWSYQPYTGQFKKVLEQLNGKDFLKIYQDRKDRLWIGSFRDGLYVVEKNGQSQHYLFGEKSKEDINFDIIRGVIEDQQGRIIINFHGGIGYFDEQTHTIKPLYIKHPELKAYKIANDMTCDKKGRIWVVANNGLYVYDPRKDQVKTIPQLIDKPEIRNQLYTNCKTILADQEGRIWIGTFNGLYIYNPETHEIERFTTNQGLPSSVIQSIVQDSQGHIWVATVNGLCQFVSIKAHTNGNAMNFSLYVFDTQSSLTDSHFLPNCATKSNQHIYFGCADGFYIIDPQSIIPTHYDGHPIITSLYIYDQEVKTGMIFHGREILETGLSTTKKVVLKYNENFITLHFSGLNYKTPHHTYYRYRLKGLDDRWTETGGQDGKGIAAYTALPPGKYTFEVYSAGVDKQWGKPTTLLIEVQAPIWATWWARLLYLILFIGAIVLFYRQRMKRNKEKLEMEKLQEVEEMKYRFFTNVSHEFRTLLTLIITPLRSVIRDTKNESELQRLQAIDRNAGDLLQLVNQLLDFRRIEMGGEKLLLHSGCINEFVEYTVNKFNSLANQRQVSLHFIDHTKGLLMYFDNDKLGKVLTNLLSNAFKFTSPEGKVTVCITRTTYNNRPTVAISVTDTGCGISENDKKHIFDRFYRAENQRQTSVGSGIGLNIVRDYVELHQGHISLESDLGQGSCFTVTIPTDLKPTQEVSPLPITNQQNKETTFTGKTVLLVEDNQEFRTFLSAELANYYTVLEAEDGQNGLLIASSKNPDIVISDVMMPRMNGTEMCQKLKNDVQTSHIPVILLTAWDSDEGRTQAYQVGADGYLQKPFDLETLLARINNLLNKHEERIRLFSHSATLDAKMVADNQTDEDFINKLIGCIEKNISDSDYGIEQLAHDILMSRMSLYRKIRSLTNQTPADFIRTVRLKYAAQLLEQGKLNVQEVGYHTGFASPQNFAKRFKDMFGVLPSQYKKR